MGQTLIKTYNIDKRVIIEEIAKLLTDLKNCHFAISVHDFGTAKNQEPARFDKDRPGTIEGAETGTSRHSGK